MFNQTPISWVVGHLFVSFVPYLMLFAKSQKIMKIIIIIIIIIIIYDLQNIHKWFSTMGCPI
jgi:hypothetical protein